MSPRSPRARRKPNYKLENENEKARRDVIKRIHDQMPNLTQDQKNRLYSSVDRRVVWALS
jgi:hypothetical protein